MAITDKEQGVWSLDEAYNKINQGGIWSYTGISQFYMWGAAEYGSQDRNESGTNPSNRPRKSSPAQIAGTTWQTEFYNSPSQAWTTILSKTDGTLWGWGKAQDWGQIGKNNRIDYSSPVQVGTNTNWRAGGGGREFSFAIKTDGTLWTWGTPSYGAQGHNNTTTKSSPTQVPGTWDNAWGYHENMLAIKPDGTLWGWGRGGGGELGQNAPDVNYSSPIQIMSDKTFARCGSGANYGAMGAITTSGELYTWGWNPDGCLGNNTHASPQYAGTSSPVQIPGTNWQYFQACGPSTLAQKTDGTLWGWGGNGGMLGQNSTTKFSSPVQIGTETTWNRMSGSPGNTIATKTDGTLWRIGGNGSGSLGQNQSPSERGGVSSPIQIPGTGWQTVGVTGENNTMIATKVV